MASSPYPDDGGEYKSSMDEVKALSGSLVGGVRDVKTLGLDATGAATRPTTSLPSGHGYAGSLSPDEPAGRFGIEFGVMRDRVGCDFSNGQCKFSPDGAFMATAHGSSLRVFNSESLLVHEVFTASGPISAIEWCPDSQYVLCGLFSRAQAQVFALHDKTWKCSINEGVSGMTDAWWSPDGKHVITAADFSLHLTVWSLVDKAMMYIENPKMGRDGAQFSKDGKHLAVAVRADCKDYVSIYDAAKWKRVRQFPVATKDLASIKWSPDGAAILVTESLIHYGLFVYRPDGALISKFKAYDNALGIKSLTWSPGGSMFSVGSYDQKVRIFSNVTWRPVGDQEATGVVKGSTAAVYVEVTEGGTVAQPDGGILRKSGEGMGKGASPSREKKGVTFAEQMRGDKKSYFVAHGDDVDVPNNMPAPEPRSSEPRFGIRRMAFSPQSEFLAFRNDNMPSALWVYSCSGLALEATIIFLNGVRSFAWQPGTIPRLAIVTGNSKLYIWESTGISHVDIEPGFQASTVQWNPEGSSMLVMSRSQWRLGYMS